MNILFAVTHVGFLRNFESTLALLAERGHRVHIVTDRRQVADTIDGAPIIDRLVSRFPNAFTVEALPFSKRQSWYGFAIAVRAALDYWRYLDTRYDYSPKLRARGRENAHRGTVWLSDVGIFRSAAGRRLLTSSFRLLEALIPVRPEVQRLFDSTHFDLVFVTPLLYFGSQQVDYVRCARRRGINSVLGVGSWDHLTTKGLIHEQPDRVLVWNELQKVEAAEQHAIAPECVTVTGAQAYDHWFARHPATSREEFCARVGLRRESPYLLYLCSSPFIAPREVGFVQAWINAVRTSGNPALRSAGILVRPHPQNAAQWADIDVSTVSNVVIWPRGGANPIRPDARNEYYDSMFHSHAVIGVNTSALIESGIVGRLVYSIRTDEFSGTQEGTLHFQHLKRGGLLRLADSLPEHLVQLGQSFGSVEQDRAQIREFVRTFVRPHGLDDVATARVVEAVEELARQPAAPRQLAPVMRVLQTVVGAVLSAVMLPFALSRLASITGDAFDSRTHWSQGWAMRRAGWLLRKRAWSAWRHATRPLRQGARRVRAAAIAVVRAASGAMRLSTRILAGGLRRLARVPARIVRGGRRTMARTRVRLGQAKRRISSSDTVA